MYEVAIAAATGIGRGDISNFTSFQTQQAGEVDLNTVFFITGPIPTEEGETKRSQNKTQQWVCRRYMRCAGEVRWTPPTKGLGIAVQFILSNRWQLSGDC